MMQGKGLIKFFLVLMALVCIWQFFLSTKTNTVDQKAVEYALSYGEQGTEAYNEKLGTYLDSISSEVVWDSPFKDYTYQDLKNSQLAYGLDLVGGMSVVMQVDLREYIQALARDNNTGPPFEDALKTAKANQANNNTDFVTLFVDAYEAANPDGSLAPYFLNTGDDDNMLNINSSNDVVASWLRTKSTGVVKNTYELLRERIDKLGVIQPNISLDAARDMIVVELPGIKNPARARAFLVATAKLEFWQTYRNSDNNFQIIQAFSDMDERLGKLNTTEDTTKADVAEFISKVDTVYVVDTLGNATTEIASIDTIQLPNPEFSQREAGPLFSLFAPNTSAGQDGQGSPIMGFARPNDTSAINALLAKSEVQNMLPRDLTLMWGYKPNVDVDAEGVEISQMYLYGIKKRKGDIAPLEGDVITTASTQNNQGQIEVTLGMNNEGSTTWFKMTKFAAENGAREVGIVLDDEVVSCPSVRNGAISGGRTSISGGFNIQEADDLARILEIGKLPATPVIIQEAVVGPTLGADNTSRSLTALGAGTLLVLLFMMSYYGGAGIVSIIALLLNVAFIFGSLASFGTVLTLPGIAGIVLTIGMAVDANVIIYERIREELRAGKSNAAAIRDGFSHSYSAIIDANVTTLLVAAVLAYFGLGPIKGFAVVLIIGVICSLFTAVLVGRLIIDWWIGKDKELSFWTGISKNAFANVKVDWLGKRKVAYMISGTIILAGLGSMFTKGFELGVEFKGGYAYNVQFADDVDVDMATLKANLKESFTDAPDPVVKSVSTSNTFSITTSYLINENEKETPGKVMTALFNGVNKTAGGNLDKEAFQTDQLGITHVISSSKVGPTIADDIRRTSFYAGIFALLVVFLYIMIRFTRWEYSAGAVAALFHDSLIVLSIFSLLHGVLPFPMEIDQAFIAALLTVIGYSINDTVVVFDRIREYMNQYTGWSKKEVVNKAIDSTISRTVITSLTTLFVIAMLFIFGRGSIQGFAFALLIGVVVGTYSSVFVATPVFYDLSGDLKPKSKTVKKQKGFRRPVSSD
jgi:SecD/SecF fusion protein